jgi:hypothetical protein
VPEILATQKWGQEHLEATQGKLVRFYLKKKKVKKGCEHSSKGVQALGLGLYHSTTRKKKLYGTREKIHSLGFNLYAAIFTF